MPHVFNERDTIAAASPERRNKSGTTCSLTISCISYGTPGTAYTTLPSPSSHSKPGAVPIGFGMASPPSGMSAWRKLFWGMSRRRDRNIVAMCSASAISRTRGTPITSAIASRVRSSWVGPRPPQISTASDRDRRSRSAATIRVWLSPIARCSYESMPEAASCSPIQALFVSTIWPSSSSVPTARTSQRIADPRDCGSPRRRSSSRPPASTAARVTPPGAASRCSRVARSAAPTRP